MLGHGLLRFFCGNGKGRRLHLGVAFTIRVAVPAAAAASAAIAIPVTVAVPILIAVPAAAVVHAIDLVRILFEEVRNVEETIPFETEVDEGGLHAGQYSGNAPFVDAAGQRILVGPLEEQLDELAVLEDPDLSLMPGLADHQFLG
ncbi:MAG: hypothetical protein HY821_16860 [Acidobacteria bacterium]|nr:hypothetical protein [Acidobacteriota bacterium]